MDQHQTAITAAFVMEGLHRANLDKVMGAYREHGGLIELVDAVMEWAPHIVALRDAADTVGAEYPGVFEYEVSLEFGAWLGGSITDDCDLPDRPHAMSILVDLVESFFRLHEDRDLASRLRAALDKAADDIMAPRAANDEA